MSSLSACCNGPAMHFRCKKAGVQYECTHNGTITSFLFVFIETVDVCICSAQPNLILTMALGTYGLLPLYGGQIGANYQQSIVSFGVPRKIHQDGAFQFSCRPVSSIWYSQTNKHGVIEQSKQLKEPSVW